LRGTWNTAWERFKVIAAIVGDVQGQVLATLFYFTVLVPFGLIARFTGDPLRLRRPDQAWIARDPVDQRLEGAKRQG
jgi:hypothetical protein